MSVRYAHYAPHNAGSLSCQSMLLSRSCPTCDGIEDDGRKGRRITITKRQTAKHNFMLVSHVLMAGWLLGLTDAVVAEPWYRAAAAAAADAVPADPVPNVLMMMMMMLSIDLVLSPLPAPAFPDPIFHTPNSPQVLAS